MADEENQRINPDADRDYFHSIPWCRAYIEDPTYARPTKGLARKVSNSYPTGHLFTCKTLNTPETIKASFTLYKKPTLDGVPILETVTFMELGSGLNGHVDTAHGGAVSAILDEVSGLMLFVGQKPESVGGKAQIFTAYIHVEYKKPVRTPQVVAVKARIAEMKGRKETVVVEMRDKDDVLLARAESLFVRVKEESKL